MAPPFVPGANSETSRLAREKTPTLAYITLAPLSLTVYTFIKLTSLIVPILHQKLTNLSYN